MNKSEPTKFVCVIFVVNDDDDDSRYLFFQCMYFFSLEEEKPKYQSEPRRCKVERDREGETNLCV